MRSRPAEIQDEKILVIEVDGFTEPGKGNSLNTLSDDRLDNLLQLILPYEPKIIGFDNFLSHPIDSKKYATLDESLRTGNLVAVCQAQVQNGERFKAPDSAISVGFGDIAVDRDEIVRRHVLSMNYNMGFCTRKYALSTLLAIQYLQGTDREIHLKKGQVGNRQFNFLSHYWGGYGKLNDDSKKEDIGVQLMLNYRVNDSSSKPWYNGVVHSSIKNICELQPQELESKIKNHIVLIGTTNSSIYQDFHKTPYGSIPGVFLQAQMTSQLVNAALHNRPLIWAYPFWGEIPMILLASLTGALLSWRVQKVWILLGCGGGAIAILFFGSVALLTEVGYWFPLVPVGLGFIFVCISMTIYRLREPKPE
jgi:CHASE2 domain-containing sensor protein